MACATKKQSALKHSAEKHTTHKHAAEKHTAKRQLFYVSSSEYKKFNEYICHLFLAEEFSEPESYSSPVKVKKSIPAPQQNEIEPIELDDGYGSPATPIISAASFSYKLVYKLEVAALMTGAAGDP